jgi:hypothetical protein
VYTARKQLEKEAKKRKNQTHGTRVYCLSPPFPKTRKEKAFFLVEFHLLVALFQPSRTPSKIKQ